MKQSKILLLGLLAINPITSMASSDSNNCQASYVPETQILHVPCIDRVTNSGDILESYAVDMQLVANTNPVQFTVKEILENSWDGINSNCRATYIMEDGRLSIPCITGTTLLGGSDNNAISMMQMVSEKQSELPSFIIISNTKQLSETEERSRREIFYIGNTKFMTNQIILPEYTNNSYGDKILSISDASSLNVKVIGETEEEYDFINIYSNGKQVKRLSGVMNESFIVNSSSIRVTFRSDESITKGGVSVIIDKVRTNNHLANISNVTVYPSRVTAGDVQRVIWQSHNQKWFYLYLYKTKCSIIDNLGTDKILLPENYDITCRVNNPTNPVYTAKFLSHKCRAAQQQTGVNTAEQGCLWQEHNNQYAKNKFTSWKIPPELDAGMYKVKVAIWSQPNNAVGGYSNVIVVKDKVKDSNSVEFPF